MAGSKLRIAVAGGVAATTLGVLAAPAGAGETAPRSPGLVIELKLRLPAIDPSGVTAAEYGLILCVC